MSSPGHSSVRTKMFSILAAVVIRYDAESRSGLLTAGGQVNDAFFDQAGVEALKDLAVGIAWLIPEAIAWMMAQEEP